MTSTAFNILTAAWLPARRLSGAVEELKPSDQTLLQAGEAVTVITPTAGGYGAPRR